MIYLWGGDKLKIEIFKLKCKRCDYEWVPRQADVRLCPHCRSPYWDREKRKEFDIKLKEGKIDSLSSRRDKQA